jgi:phosphoglycerate dehydrogenase-like enzyme
MQAVHLPTYERLADELPDTDILVGFSIRPEQFAQARRLKWIHATAAAVAQLMYAELRNSGVVVTNASGIHSIPMGEHIVGTMIALARRFPDCFRYQRESHWCQQELWERPAAVRPRELRGQVALFIGFGAVGREAARMAGLLGLRIWAVTRSGRAGARKGEPLLSPDEMNRVRVLRKVPGPLSTAEAMQLLSKTKSSAEFPASIRADEEIAERVLPASALHEALPHADFVVLAAPETPETTKMIGERELAQMKPSAYFINVARGALVDEPALNSALQKGMIAGAALDVTSEEPLPPESPLWKLDNVFITPHVSAVSERLWERQTDLLMENLERWFDGRELVNRVDFARGY